MSEARIRSDQIPRHVAIIMDGNGRWAEAQGRERNEGHRAGLESVREIVRGARELGIEYLTLYAFSMENWNRPKGEVGELMRLLEHYLEVEIDEVIRNGIQCRAIGRLDRLPSQTRKSVEDAIARTAENREMILTFALSYGGRCEIVDAARKLLRAAELGDLDPESLDEKTFASYLYEPEIPDPDLVIRTGAESRISNFLLWQVAYSEIYISELMWPAFRKPDLEDAILEYRRRERRFGLTSAQVGGAGRGSAG
jgi:undecaprenyl diphosphate synthase